MVAFFDVEESQMSFELYAAAMPNLSVSITPIWSDFQNSLSQQALYPMLIILIATLENARPDNLNDMSLSQSIQFASRQVHQEDYSGTESQ